MKLKNKKSTTNIEIDDEFSDQRAQHSREHFCRFRQHIYPVTSIVNKGKRLKKISKMIEIDAIAQARRIEHARLSLPLEIESLKPTLTTQAQMVGELAVASQFSQESPSTTVLPNSTYQRSFRATTLSRSELYSPLRRAKSARGYY